MESTRHAIPKNKCFRPYLKTFRTWVPSLFRIRLCSMHSLFFSSVAFHPPSVTVHEKYCRVLYLRDTVLFDTGNLRNITNHPWEAIKRRNRHLQDSTVQSLNRVHFFERWPKRKTYVYSTPIWALWCTTSALRTQEARSWVNQNNPSTAATYKKATQVS